MTVLRGRGASVRDDGDQVTEVAGVARPDEIATTAVDLASADGVYVVGATLHVNGGDVMP